MRVAPEQGRIFGISYEDDLRLRKYLPHLFQNRAGEQDVGAQSDP